MRLWLLDADVVIKFLEIDIFDKLAGLHEIHVASSVIDEVKYYHKSGKKIPVNFRQQYIDTGKPEDLSTKRLTMNLLRESARRIKRLIAGLEFSPALQLLDCAVLPAPTWASSCAAGASRPSLQPAG